MLQTIDLKSITADGAAPALVVDLDHTLIRTNVLIESILALIRSDPVALLMLPLWLLRGRAYLKAQIAARVNLDVVTLPYRASVLGLIADARRDGRPVVLATATHATPARRIADHLGLFDAVLATSDDRNLKGTSKAQAIQQHLGRLPFDYIGDSKADQPIWQVARQPITVGSRPRLNSHPGGWTAPVSVGSADRPTLRTVVRMLRVHQWLKNILVFVPLLAAHQYASLDDLLAATTAFFAFSLCASSVYVLNDLLDLEADRRHERKRHRPFAAGDIPLTHGFVAIPLLLAVSGALSLALPNRFLLVVGFYYACTVVYSMWAKRRVVVDVIVLAGLYTLRLFAGAAATGIEPSFWLLALSEFIFFSLAMVKRYGELLRVMQSGADTVIGRGYRLSDMPVLLAMGSASACCAVMVMALYVNSPDVLRHYSHPQALWMICPLLLFWLTRLWLKATRAEVSDDPMVFAATDLASLGIGALCVLTILAGNW